MNISVVIMTKNASTKLKMCLDSLSAFDDVIVYDNGSVDGTIDIAKKYANVTIRRGEFLGFGQTKKEASKYSKYDWILSLDSDEVVSKELIDELLSAKLDKSCVYELKRDNYYKNNLIKSCGWNKEFIIRVYNKEVTNFNSSRIHELVVSKHLSVVRLGGVIKHYSFDEIGDFLNKIQKYSTMYANEHVGKKKSSLLKAVTRGFFSFFKSYVIRYGFIDGFDGFVISFFNGLGTFMKYLKLYEQNKEIKHGEGDS